MAVGLNKAEIAGNESVLAKKHHNFLHSLPSNEIEVTLSYSGKISESDILNPVSTDYLKLVDGFFVPTNNIGSNSFFWADNLFVLDSLIEKNQKAQLIYLDPPYSTGMNFQSRDQQHAYNDTLGSAAYVEFMRRRLILMREVMEDSGSIYLHIGHQMLGELKIIMDEVFGKKNFRNIITRKKCSSKNFTKNQYSNLNDYILFYSKSSNYIWNQPSQKADPEWISREYPKVDDRGQYKLVPIHAPGVRKGETGKEWRGMLPPTGKHWQYAPSKLDELDANGEIHWSKTGNPRRKVYLPQDKGIALSDYWDGFRDAHHQSILITGYPTEKNFDMMKMIVGASSNEGGLVIDPFCGSGTTIHAAEVLGRKWIGIDQSLLAAKTVCSRLISGRKPMGSYAKSNLELNFSHENSMTIEEHEAADTSFDFFVDSEIAATYPSELQEIALIKKVL